MGTNDYNPRANDGLADEDFYEPEAIGSAALSAGEPEQTWPEFGLEMVPVLHDGEDTGRRFIRQNGNYIASATEDYSLLPNEEVVRAANEVARDLGADPFHEFDGDWFIKLDDHVYQDEERRRVHALYAFESGFVGDDELEYGFAVHNSIDTSLAFSVSLFSFRHACANMVNIGVGNAMARAALNVESEREVLASSSHKHTSGLDVDQEALRARIKGTMALSDNVAEAYRRFHETAIEPTVALSLAERLPGKNLPDWLADSVDALKDEAEADDEANRWTDVPRQARIETVERHTPTAETMWDTYNDVTESVWHDENSQDTTKQRKFDKLHRAMPVLD